MKIVILTPSNVAGGAERVLTSLANQFSLTGENVYFVTFDKKSCFYPLNRQVKIIRLGIDIEKRQALSKYLQFPKCCRFLKKVLKKIDPDIVISFSFITNVVGITTCKKLGVPIIISERNDPLKYPKHRQLAMKAFYKKAEGLVCQSDIVKTFYEHEYGIRDSCVIFNPITETQVGEMCTNKEKKILAVGRLIPQKNFEMLITAFSEVYSCISGYTLEIYGEGPLKEDLEMQIRKCSMENHVFLRGISKEAIKNNNDASLFILSSDFEGFPNVLVEAMANGMVCIATDVSSGTVREIIQDGENGYIFPVGGKEELKKTIIKAISHQSDMNRIAINAGKIKEILSIESISERWMEYIRQITNVQRTRPWRNNHES